MRIRRSACRLFSTFSKSQRATSNSVSLNSIKELHAQLIRTQMHIDPFSISEVIKHYALSPQYLHKAHFVFNQIQGPTLFVWNHMIHGLSRSDRPNDAIHFYNTIYKEVLDLFREMQAVNVRADSLTMMKVILASSCLSEWETADDLVKYIDEHGVVVDIYLGNTLIDIKQVRFGSHPQPPTNFQAHKTTLPNFSPRRY
ncbi:unnamed protein product [Citrullus colocynthis]|uniref:Pentatricopeptide repeat-containing protein n=1 Tax=Citrullus colocynthis TaxID=252529 RepID=A0ABP0YFF5_9ROSI